MRPVCKYQRDPASDDARATRCDVCNGAREIDQIWLDGHKSMIAQSSK